MSFIFYLDKLKLVNVKNKGAKAPLMFQETILI